MTLLHEPDFGTPERDSDVTVELTVDGAAVSVPAGTSVAVTWVTSWLDCGSPVGSSWEITN